MSKSMEDRNRAMRPCRTTKQQERFSISQFDYVACVTIADMPVPPYPSEESVCVSCAAPIWISLRVKAVVDAPRLCLACAVKKAEELGGESSWSRLGGENL
jgi:hypothetical protein